MTETNTNEIRTTSPTGGQKGVKPERHSLIPVEALNSIARLYGFGAKKYDAHNWRKGYDWSKSYDAMNRHMAAFWSGEDNDPETGEPHMASVAFHAMTLIVFMQEQPEFDDRYIPERENDPEAERKIQEARQSEEALAVLREKLSGANPNVVLHNYHTVENANGVNDPTEIDLDFNKVALREPAYEGLGEFSSTPLRRAHFDEASSQE